MGVINLGENGRNNTLNGCLKLINKDISKISPRMFGT